MLQQQCQSKTTRMSLPIPEQIKAAAIAITKCSVPFYESSKDPCGGPQLGDGGTYNGVGSFRVPQVMLWLCRAGMPTVLRHIDHALQLADGDLQATQAVFDFFRDNPSAREVSLVDFDPSSEAAMLFISMADGCGHDEAVTMDRRTAMSLHAEKQEKVMQLSEAKGALLTAISTAKPQHVA